MNMKSTPRRLESKSRSVQILSIAVVGSVGILSSQNSWSMGKAPAPAPTPTASSSPNYTVPNPIRQVIVRGFADVSSFVAPNQVTTAVADTQATLNTLITSALSANTEFQPVSSISSMDGCGSHLELWPSVLDFQINSTQIDLTFGFNQGGSIVVNPALPQATGTDTLSIGNITLAFQLYECPNSGTGNCSLQFASQANQSILGNNFSFTVDYTALGGSGDIISKTDLEGKLSSIITAGVKTLAANAAVPSLPWSATVAMVNSDGTFYFDQGTTQNLKPTDYFVVYAQTPAVSVCEVIQAVGCAAPVASGMGGPSTLASIFKTLGNGSQKVQPGDQVLVGSATSCF